MAPSPPAPTRRSKSISSASMKTPPAISCCRRKRVCGRRERPSPNCAASAFRSPRLRPDGGRGGGDQRRGRAARRRHCRDAGNPAGAPMKPGATSAASGDAAAPEPGATRPQLRECPGCGLLQLVPALAPGGAAYCARCPTVLRRVSGHRLQHVLALALSALILLVVMSTSSLMSVETAGIRRVANLFSGPEELVQQQIAPLAAVVLFVTVLAPLLRL